MDDINMGLNNMLVILCMDYNLCFSFMNNVCFESLAFESKISKLPFNFILNWNIDQYW
jgi:hypothetical protein